MGEKEERMCIVHGEKGQGGGYLRWRDVRCSLHIRLEDNTTNHSQLLSYRSFYFFCCSLPQILIRSLDCRPRFTIPSNHTNSHYHDDQTCILNRANHKLGITRLVSRRGRTRENLVRGRVCISIRAHQWRKMWKEWCRTSCGWET